MNSFQATGFPFASIDLIKAWHHFKLPALSIGALLEAHRKNAAALANANQVVFDGVKTLAKHQGDLFAASVNDCSQAAERIPGRHIVRSKVHEAGRRGQICLRLERCLFTRAIRHRGQSEPHCS